MKNLILATIPLIFAIGCGDKEEDTGSAEVEDSGTQEEAEEGDSGSAE